MPNAAADAERACAAQECEQSIGFVEKLLQRRPHDFTLLYRLGVCHGGVCRPHSLVSREIAMAYLRQALWLARGNSRVEAAVLEQLGNAAARLPDAAPAELRQGCDCFIRAAALFRLLEMPDDWARLQFNLGNACCDLAELTGRDYWTEAVSHYTLALEVRTRERDPGRHAAVLENLGTAYRRLPGHAAESVRCYRRAMAVYTAHAYPEKHAAVQNNLGNALLSISEKDEDKLARNARLALRHFERALAVQSANPNGRAFAVTQYNAAQAHLRLAAAGSQHDARLAIDCLRAAGDAFRSCGDTRYSTLARAQLDRVFRRPSGFRRTASATSKTLDSE